MIADLLKDSTHWAEEPDSAFTAEVFNVDDTTDVPAFLYSLNEDGPFGPWDQIEIRDVKLDDADEVTSNKVWYTVTTKTAVGDETHFSMTDESVITDVGEEVNAIDGDKLQPLSGSVIGGSFSCEPNEFDPVTWQEEFLCQGWNESAGNQQYLMDAITGTWSIKANKSIRPAATLLPAEAALLKNLTDGNALEELQLLKACGQKIDKSWNLLAVEPNFASKWF